ncbi:MAG: caspase family protein [Caldilineaceae bacterium]|nr:caspase family protein [Caldilineaceae bacterium]
MTHTTRSFRLADPRSPTAAEFQQSLAVVIGINAYQQGIPPLRTARADAEQLAHLLATQHGYQVELLVDQVTVPQLLQLLQHALPQRVGPQDRLLVYFAGHGIALPGEDGPAGYLLLQDADAADRTSFLPMQQLHDAVAQLPCRHCLVILDCCFAGAFRWSTTRSLSFPHSILYRERYARFLRSPAWQVLTSAAYDQEALDSYLGQGWGARDAMAVETDAGIHSPFALALFAALTGAGDTNQDGVLIATELYLYLRDQVEVRAAQVAKHLQTPGLWPLQKHDKGEFIFLLGEPDLPPAPPLTTANNPYRGLQSYDEQHADLFFGRQLLVAQLAALVENQVLTVVLGASGTGKSSLVKAGLLPHLRRATDTSPGWHILPVLRPTEAPLQVFQELVDRLQQTPSPALLVIDQFEELITLCHHAAERTAFLELLAELLTVQGGGLHLVLTLRTDFEPPLAQGALAAWWSAGRFVVPPMNQRELRACIDGPANARVLFFDPPTLVDHLIDEVIQTPGALPLLSFTLEQLYLRYLERQSLAQQQGETIERALTEADYQALGGVIGSLRTRAEEEYAALPDDAHRATMARLMVRMIAAEGSEVARRRVLLTELDYPSAAENQRVQRVIERLVAARLLVSDSADVNADGVADAHVEPAHDALVRAWDRLLRWKQDFAEFLPLQRSLTAAADEWTQAGAPPRSGLLWNNNPRLPQLQAILHPSATGEPSVSRLPTIRHALWPSTKITDQPTWLNRQETLFVQQSVARRAALLKRIVAITMGVILVLTGLTLFAFDRQRVATNNANELAAEVVVRATAQAIAVAQRDLARSRELAVVAQDRIADDPEQALLIALAANEITRTLQSEAALRAALQASPLRGRFAPAGKTIQAMALAPTGDQLLITGMADEGLFAQLLAFPALTPTRALKPGEGYSAYTNGFSPKGRYAWAIYDDTTLQIWDSQRGTLVLTAPAAVVGWFPDEQRIVTAQLDDPLLQVWDLTQGKVLSTLGDPAAEAAYPRLLQVTPDQQQVILVSWPDFAFAVTAWDLQSGRQLTHFPVDPSLSFSPDGGLMAYGQDAAVVLRDTVRQTVIMSATMHSLDVLQTVFSADGHYVASLASDNTIYLWQIVDAPPNAALIPLFSVPTNGSTQVTFVPDRPLLLAWNDSNGLLTGWSMATRATQVATVATGQPIRQLQVASQGAAFVTMDREGTLRTWSADFGEEWANVPPLPQLLTSGVNSAHLTPDGKQIAVTVDQQLHFFDLTARTWQSPTLTMTENIDNFAFTPDGTQVVAYGNQEIAWWSLPSGVPLGTITVVSATVGSAVLDPTGRYGAAALAVKRPDPAMGNEVLSTAALWQTATQQWQPLADIPHYRAIETLSFAPDGASLLVVGATAINEAGANHLVRVWEVATGELRFAQDFGPETAVAYLPDSQRLLIVRREALSLWDLTTGTQLATVTPAAPLSTVTMAISADGQRAILPDGFTSTAQVWDLATLQPRFSLVGHAPGSTISTIQISQDGALIVTASSGDDKIRLWDGATGALLSVLPYARDQELSTDGRFVMSKTAFGLPQLYLARFPDLLALAQRRVTRPLTCAERRDLLHEAVVCPVATPMPVAS